MSEGDHPALIVAVGASAGGIEACQALFHAMPPRSGLAFVVVMHLDPSRSSQIAEILQRGNDQLRFVQAQGSERLTAGCVYVIAPNSKLSLADGTLHVEPLTNNETRGGLVDLLFCSLAEAQGDRAVGVVLSGGGEDGTRGLRAISKAGGLCLAQDPTSAASYSMPQSAIESGLVDAVLPPDGIPDALIAFARDGTRPGRRADREIPREESAEDQGSRGLQRVLEHLGDFADVNFADYKIGTLERRTRRRMDLKQIEDWGEYADLLAHDRDELDALYHDVLIGVTEFFRDPDVWEHVADQLPHLREQRREPGFRVWVPGCATGEEAYTIAMLLCERLPAREISKVQIYATDLSERALAIARRGVYSIEALERMGGDRRERNFNQIDGRLQIERKVRDCVTFAQHNVLSDPPFSNMDLVSCRNLLIYLRPQAHNRLLKRLHFALHNDGLLILGRAERLGRQNYLFDEISKPQSIFRKRPVAHGQRFQVSPKMRRVGADTAGAVPAPLIPRNDSAAIDGASLVRRIEQYVLRQHTTALAVVNVDGVIQHLYGPTDQYLAPPTGESRQDLLAWLRPGLYTSMRLALQQAVDTGEALDVEGQVERGDEVTRVQASIEPLPKMRGAERLFVVTFCDIGSKGRPAIPQCDSDEPVMREFEQEVVDLRRDLQLAIEQLEVEGEEHRAGNEELRSLNEELQSSNEELEASKEELEALNEEMNTINRELEQKNSELREANSDLDNLFLSTGIPTLFLDEQLHVRRFTEAATDVFRIVPSDIGRSIEHVKELFDDARTADACSQVLKTLQPHFSEVRVAADNRTFLRRILPYRTSEYDVEGVCITFSDVTEQHEATAQSEAAREYAETIIRTVRTPLLIVDEDLRISSMNDAFRASFGINGQNIGQRLSDARDLHWNVPKLDDLLTPVLSKGDEVDNYEVTSKDRNVLINARRVNFGKHGRRVVLSFEDVTDHRRASERADQRAIEMRDDARRKDQWIAMLGHELRNPIGAVGNALELLKSDSLSAEHARAVGIMNRQIAHVADLLDELLDAARILAGKLDIDREPVDLTEIGGWALDTVSRLMQDRRHALTSHLPPRGTVWAEGDSVRLTEVLSNLLTNAAKYTEPGGEIEFQITADEGAVTIRVCDNGVGISESLKAHIFEMFTQGPRSLDRQDCGLGIGLPLVKNLVEAHGGEVHVLSEGEGKGSEFRITLPRLKKAVQHRPVAASKLERTAPPRRVLVVDDLTDAAESLAMWLRNKGHEVRTASDGPEALEVADEFDTEVALLDLGLIGMDGYELARRLRTDHPDTTLIAVTGYQRKASDLAAAGFDEHLLKPIDMEQLDTWLTKLPSGSRSVEPG